MELTEERELKFSGYFLSAGHYAKALFYIFHQVWHHSGMEFSMNWKTGSKQLFFFFLQVTDTELSQTTSVPVEMLTIRQLGILSLGNRYSKRPLASRPGKDIEGCEDQSMSSCLCF